MEISVVNFITQLSTSFNELDIKIKMVDGIMIIENRLCLCFNNTSHTLHMLPNKTNTHLPLVTDVELEYIPNKTEAALILPYELKFLGLI